MSDMDKRNQVNPDVCITCGFAHNSKPEEDPTHCPECSSDGITTDGGELYFSDTGDIVSFEFRCDDCEHEWANHYKYTHMTDGHL